MGFHNYEPSDKIEEFVGICYAFRFADEIDLLDWRMGQFDEKLKYFYDRSTYRSIAALARAAQAQTEFSESYLKQLMSGGKTNPSYQKVVALAIALGLDHQETNELLEAAGYQPQAAVSLDEASLPVRQIFEALNQLRVAPTVSLEAFEHVANGIIQMVDGVRLALSGGLPTVLSTKVIEQTGQTTPSTAPTPEENTIETLLREILLRRGDSKVDNLFGVLERAAMGDRWEMKRRIAEKLPQLVVLRPERTLKIAEILRLDYHPEYRADIRRRVIEGVPVLARYRLDESLSLLDQREGDEIYMGMAIIEDLFDMQADGLITEEIADQYRRQLQFDDPLHREIIGYLSRLLDEVRNNPATALKSLNARRDDPERLIKICVQRTTPRLLSYKAKASLDLMAYFLRRDSSEKPLEHQNLRRPVSRALPQILQVYEDGSKAIKQLITEMVWSLATDPDIHVRRALGDALERLIATNPELGREIIDHFSVDPDQYIVQRVDQAVYDLEPYYPERVQDYLVDKLLTPSS